MLDKLRKLNPELRIYSVKDKEFNAYGRVIDFDTEEITKACAKLKFPESASEYRASVYELENLKCSKKLRQTIFGGCNAQIGICHGYNSVMNAMEFHYCSEINIAATPLVLIVGLRQDMKDKEFDSENVKAFYLEKGDAVEVYATTLHFCPCQVTDDGFSAVVGLPEGTNCNLDCETDDRLLFRKNKWIICHEDNSNLIEKGVYPGIHGINYSLKY